ncbi:MAG TPA: YciI family protein, partial [Terriglobales bacterium]|nr:YciI family protein [Terriglobales bacterium]
MYALAIIRYRRPLEEIAAVTENHRAYLRELKKQGVLIASGPFDPRFGGALLLRVKDDD